MHSSYVDAMDKLIGHALVVQKLYRTIDACGRKEDKRNVTLLNELVRHLLRTLRKINLFTQSKWIYSIAENACLELHSKPKSLAFLITHFNYLSSEVPKQKPSEFQSRNSQPEIRYSKAGCCAKSCAYSTLIARGSLQKRWEVLRFL